MWYVVAAATITSLSAIVAAFIVRDGARKERDEQQAKKLDKIIHDTGNLRALVPICCRIEPEDATHLRDFLSRKESR